MNLSNKPLKSLKRRGWMILPLCMILFFVSGLLGYWYFPFTFQPLFVILWMLSVFAFGLYCCKPLLTVLLGTGSFWSFVLGVRVSFQLLWGIRPDVDIKLIGFLLLVTAITAFSSFGVGFAFFRFSGKLPRLRSLKKAKKIVFLFPLFRKNLKRRARKTLLQAYLTRRTSTFYLLVGNFVLISVILLVCYMLYRGSESNVIRALLLLVSIPVVISFYLAFKYLSREELSLFWKITFWTTVISLTTSYYFACLSYSPESSFHFKELTALTIERVLQKSKIREPSFFRHQDPLWIDFEKNIVPELPITNEAIDKLDMRSQIWIIGDTGGGKELILRQIGYNLAKMGHKVYLLDLQKEEYGIERVISFFEGEKIYLLVNNAQLDLEFSNKILEKITPKAKVIMVSTNIEQELGTYMYPTKLGLIRDLSSQALQVQTAKVADAMIVRFAEIHNMEEQVRILAEIFWRYKNSLALLRWALQTYLSYGRVDDEKIYEFVKYWLTAGLESEHGIEGASNILFPISIFSNHRLPLKKKFLTREFDVEENDLKGLMQVGVIEEYSDDLISFSSDDMGRLLSQVMISDSSLAQRAKEHLSSMGTAGSWEQNVFLLYLLTFPELNHAMVGSSGISSALRSFLLSNEQIQKNITTSLQKEQNLRKIARVVYELNHADETVARKIWKALPMASLQIKIEKEKNINDLEYFFRRVSWGRDAQKTSRKLFDNLNLNRLVLRLTQENDLEQIGSFISTFLRCPLSSEVRQSFEQLIGGEHFLQDLQDKINGEEDVAKIVFLFRSLAMKLDRDTIDRVSKGVDGSNFMRKLENEQSFSKVAYILWGLWEIKIDLWSYLFENLGFGFLNERLINSDLRDIAEGFEYLCNMFDLSEEYKTFVGRVIRRKVQREHDFPKISGFLQSVSYRYQIRREIVRDIDLLDLKGKMEKENDFWHLKKVLVAFEETDHEIAKQLLGLLDYEIIANKLPKEPFLGSAAEFIDSARAISKDWARELVYAADVWALRSSILAVGSIYSTGLLLGSIAKVDSQVAQSLARSLYLFLNSHTEEIGTMNLRRIGKWFINMSLVDDSLVRDMAGKIDVETIREKLSEEGRNLGFSDLMRCFAVIPAADGGLAEELLSIVEPKMRETSNIKRLATSVAEILRSRNLINENIMTKLLQITYDKIRECEDEYRQVESIGKLVAADKEIGNMFLPLLLKIVSKEENLRIIGSYITGIAHADTEFAKRLIRNIGVEELELRFQTEDFFWNLGYFWGIMMTVDKETGYQLKDIVDHRVREEDDLDNIAGFFSGISYKFPEVGREVLASLRKNLKSKVARENNLYMVGSLIGSTEQLDTGFATGLLRIVKDKIKEGQKTENIRWFNLHLFIEELPREIGKRFVTELGRETFETVIERERSLENCAYLVRTVDETGNKKMARIMTNRLRQRVEAENDVVAIGYCLSALSSSYYNEPGQHTDNALATNLLRNLDSQNLKRKIEAEQKLDRMIFLAERLARVNQEVAEATVGTVLVERLNQAEDFAQIQSTFHQIVQLCEKWQIDGFSKELLHNLDMDIIKKRMSQGGDVAIIGQFVKDVAKLDKELADNIVDSLSPRFPELMKHKQTH